MQEQQPIPQIFDQPISQAARDFARTGSCNIASPGTPSEHLDASVTPAKPPPKAALRTSHSQSGPRGFLWLKKGKLAGTPLPGVYFDVEYDLKALQRVGITRLITLTETPLDAAALEPFGIQSVWEPIPDMEAPSIEQGIRICKKIEALLAEGEVIAVHCRAGLGRTGTVLAAHLIWEGRDSLSALEYVRRIEPRWVQSETQIEFLSSFSNAV